MKQLHGVRVPVERAIQSPSGLVEGEDPLLVALVRDVSERFLVEEQRRDEAENLAATQDRNRVVRDLHDTVIQRVFNTGLALNTSIVLVHEPAVADRLEAVVEELNTIIREIRGAVFALQVGPPS